MFSVALLFFFPLFVFLLKVNSEFGFDFLDKLNRSFCVDVNISFDDRLIAAIVSIWGFFVFACCKRNPSFVKNYKHSSDKKLRIC